MTAPTTISEPVTTRGEAGQPFEPIILGFTCNWCSYRAADLAGTARTKYPPNVRLIRLMCSGRMEPEFILEGFAKGADAVIMTGCWPEDCHYRIQSVKALRRFVFLRRTLADLGIDPARLQRFYASAAEGQRFANEIARIVEEVRQLGPLDRASWTASSAKDRDSTAPGPALTSQAADRSEGASSATTVSGALEVGP